MARKVICLQTLEIYNTIIECSRKVANINRNNMSLTMNINGETKYYKGFTFEYYDENKKYHLTTTQEQEKAYSDYLEWKDKPLYILNDTGTIFKKYSHIAKVLKISKQGVEWRLKHNHESILQITNYNYYNYYRGGVEKWSI